MDQENPFADFLCRLRAGDPAAASRFVDDYRPVILRAVGKRLSRFGLRRCLDPADICQEVLLKFFAKIATHFEFDGLEEMGKLLLKMTHDQIIDEFRHALANSRSDAERDTQYEHLEGISSAAPPASQRLDQAEQLCQIHKQMTEKEWCLASSWALGRPWEELAAEWCENPDALRMTLVRAIARVKHDLNPA